MVRQIVLGVYEKPTEVALAVTLVLPWYPIYYLQMPLRQRLAIIGIFLTGGFVIASGVTRTVFVVQATKQGLDNSCECYIYQQDSRVSLLIISTNTEAPGFYWSTIQAASSVVSACLPSMRPLIRGKSFGSLFKPNGLKVFQFVACVQMIISQQKPTC